MIIAAIFIISAIIFFTLHRHAGTAIIATVAGIFIIESVGGPIANAVSNVLKTVGPTFIKNILVIVFAAGLPLLLYMKSHRTSLLIFRVLNALAFAALLALVYVKHLSLILPFDQLSRNIMSNINSYYSFIVLGIVIFGYVDLLLDHGKN